MNWVSHPRAIFVTALLSSVFVLGSLPCLSQQKADPVTVPVQVVSGLVYMQGSVNGSPPLSAILDTGSSLSIVSPSVAQALDLHSAQTTQAAGIGKGASQTLRLLDDCAFAWGTPESPLRLLHQSSAILPIDYIASQTGRRADAIFGSNLFLHYIITVDYARQIVTFALPGHGPPPSGTAIPIEVSGNTPFVRATVEGEDGKKIEGLFLMDSGTAGAMILNKSFLDAHPGMIATAHAVDSPTVIAVGGAIRSQRVRLPHIAIGPLQFSDVIAVVPETSSGILANPAIAGFIGAAMMRRFTVTWDYANQRAYFLPNSTIKEPFDTDASGLHLTASGPAYRTITIDSVLPGSPAALAGLEPGDEIAAIDKRSGLPLWEIAEALRKAGTSVVLDVKRKTAEKTIPLALRNPFESRNEANHP